MTQRPKTAFFSSISSPHRLSIQTLQRASSTRLLSTLFTSPFSNSCKLLLNPGPSRDATLRRPLPLAIVVVLIGGSNLLGGNVNPAFDPSALNPLTKKSPQLGVLGRFNPK